MRVESSSAGGTAAAGDTMSAARLGKDFMQLLVTQLQNQDPMQPLQDRELVSQLAQLSTLDTMERLEQAMANGQLLTQLSQAAALIGRVVRAEGAEGEVSGKVTAASIGANSQVLLAIGDKSVGLSDVLEVTAG